MAVPAAALAPPDTTDAVDDLDVTALARWWEQFGAQASCGALARRIQRPATPVGSPGSPDSDAPPAPYIDLYGTKGWSG